MGPAEGQMPWRPGWSTTTLKNLQRPNVDDEIKAARWRRGSHSEKVPAASRRLFLR